MKIENVKLVDGKYFGTIKIKNFEVPVEIRIDYSKLPWNGLPVKFDHD